MYRVLVVFFVLCLSACQESYVPKPRAYFRISFPDKNYAELEEDLPFSFEKTSYAELKIVRNQANQMWLNLSTPANKADIHLTYEVLHHDLAKHIEEARKLAYDHSIKADAIEEQLYINREKRVYGIVYRIKGNAASPMQFFLTDSTQHFIRGSFYIREIPNIDSIQPVIDFYDPDVVRLVETFEWKTK